MAGRAGDCFEERFRAEGSCRRVTDLHGRAGDARVSARRAERSSLLPCFPRRRRMSGIGLRAVGRDTPGKERDRTKQNRRTNDKRLFCFVSFTKCLCTPLFVCTHLRLSCSSSTSPEPLSGRVSSDIWGRSPVSPSTYLLVSARGYIRRAGYPLLAPLRRQERTVALTIPASYGASLGCSSGCSPERGWAFREERDVLTSTF